MRTLLLMRGAPGSGKSTWIKNHNLEQYTLSPDTVRVMCSSLELQPTGEFKVSQDGNNEKVVWEVLFKLLEHRMERGEFTVIDVLISIGLMIVVIFLLIKYGLKIYKVGILNYSSDKLWRKMFKALKN